MTDLEHKIAVSLNNCTFLPGSFDKRFVKQLRDKLDQPMTDKGRAFMMSLFHKYRRQIPDYDNLNGQLIIFSSQP